MVQWGRRLLTVSVFIPLAVYCLLDDVLGGLLVWAVSSGACWEMVFTVTPAAVCQAASADGPTSPAVTARLPRLAQWVAFICSSAILALPVWDPTSTWAEAGCLAAVVLTVATFMVCMAQAHSKVPQAEGRKDTAWRMDTPALVGLLLLLCTPLLLASPLSYAIRLASLPHGKALQLAVGGAIWNADTGALVVGSALGGPKLLPSISPGKTIAGFAGSLLGAGLTLAGAVAAQGYGWLPDNALPPLTTASWVTLGITAGVGAVLGDLLESAIKRAAVVKDSGGVLPGQGGLLDRMDSALFVTPLVFHMVKAGVVGPPAL